MVLKTAPMLWVFRPAAISLDILLPDMLGWTVLNQLKLDPTTRHIPVQIVTMEEERQHGLAHGAFSYLVKEPTTAGLETASSHVDHGVSLFRPRGGDSEYVNVGSSSSNITPLSVLERG
jgi:CheY-like chemotaxis protein